MVLTVAIGSVCSIAVLVLYLKLTCGYCRCSQRLDGLTAIVTGANIGIGKETARQLARQGARVILACRDLKKAEEARDEIILSTGNPNVVVHHLDLSSLQSVRQFAQKIVDTEKRLHVLVNNAGFAGSHKVTADGINLTMQVNHFGPFLLTLLLLELLKKSAPSRIVMVSSLLHKKAKLNVEDLTGTKNKQTLLEHYSNSKLCNLLVANELTRRLSGTGVTANSLHPGAVWTGIWRKFPNWQFSIIQTLAPLFMKTSKQGAQTTIHLCMSEDLQDVSGQYFVDCKVAKPARAALDEELAKKVWEASVRHTALTSETQITSYSSAL